MLTVLLRNITPFPPLRSSSSATQSDLWLLRSHPDGLMPHPKPLREPSGSSEATQSFLCFLRSTHRPLSDSCEATQTLFWLLRSHPDGRLTHPKRDRPSSASSKASNNRRLSIACSSSHIGTQTRLSKIEGRRCALPRGPSIESAAHVVDMSWRVESKPRNQNRQSQICRSLPPSNLPPAPLRIPPGHPKTIQGLIL